MASANELEEEVITVEDELSEDPSSSDELRFHCVADWKIRNFGCCQLESGEELFSPLFSADSSARARWYLSTFPNGQAGFEEFVSIHVVFTRPADGLRASCKVSIVDFESNVWTCDRIDRGQSPFRFDAFVKRERLFGEKNKVFPQDTLTIRCQISAFDPETVEPEPGCLTPRLEGLRVFAEDFEKLYESGTFSDVTLKTRNGVIQAHKVILSARSPVFAELFREPQTTYSVPDYDNDAMDALLSYVYSGRADPALSLDLYELAREYGVRELVSALQPNEIFAQTEITNETFAYTWRIRNFGGMDAEPPQTMRYSGKFHTGPHSRAWSLSVCFERIPDDDSDRYLAVYLNKLWATGDKKAVYIHFSVCLLDREGRPCHTVEAERLYKSSGRYGFPNFIRRSSLLQQRTDLLKADTLTVRCDMRVCDGASTSTVRHAFHSATEASDVEGLSSSLGELLRSERDSDVTVCATEREFHLHKPVLCARSTVFTDFFKRCSNNLSNYTINIQGIRAEILELLFTFVYTGELEGGPSCATAPGLLVAADHYKIPGLKKICSDFMKSHACEILVTVSQTSDAKIQELVKNFVCSNAEDVLASDQWPEFVRNHPRMSSGILKSLADGYREAKRRRVE